MKKPILCIDFDGVLHSYTSGWKGPRNIPDPPVAGAVKWLRSLLSDPECICCMAPRYLDFDVQIYSSRSRYIGGRRAMKKWLKKWFVHYGFEPSCVDELIKFPKKKPSAFLQLDDRAITFTGEFPTVEFMKEFRPWNKKNKTHKSIELYVLVGNVGCGKSTFAKNKVKFDKSETGINIVNMDSIQEMIGGEYGNYDYKKKDIYWAIEEKAICESLERGFSVIIDRTNMDKKRRKRFIDIGKRYPWVSIICRDFGPGSDKDLERRKKDNRGIEPDKWEEVFNKMKDSYEQPAYDEGFNEIITN